MPTPTPTPSPEHPVGNLLTIPDSFYETQYWSYISIDTEVYRSYPSSIRLDADYERGTRECISYWINVFPGDHIYFGAWCKTSNDVTNTVYTGGRIGIDFYAGEWDDLHVVDGLPHAYTMMDGVWCSGDGDAQMSNFGHPPVSQFLVPFGKDWTYIYYDIVVPDTYYTISASGEPVNGTIKGIIPRFDARQITDGQVWFDDAELYINP